MSNWLFSNPSLLLLWFYVLITIIAGIGGTIYPLWIGGAALSGTLVILLLRSKSELILFDLLPLLAILELWVAPAILYVLQKAFPDFYFVYVMPVPGQTYFAIAIPSVLAICLGSQVPRIWSLKEDTPILQQVQVQLYHQPWLPALLIAMGLLALWAKPYLGIGWRLVGHYVSQLIWIGGIHALLTPRYLLFNRLLSFGALCLLIRDALYSTMFGYVVFWIIFGVCYVQVARQWAFWKIALSGFIGVALVALLLTFKYQYRGMAEKAGGNTLQRAGLFLQALKDRINDPWGHAWSLQQPLQRVNQGYHLALTYKHVPAEEPFANGTTIKTAFISALVPRLFWKDKPMAGGQTNYPRFTGVALYPGVSTNIGPAGDAYVNFGKWGAALFLFFYAFTLRLLYDGYRWLAKHWYAPIWVWVPLISFSCIFVEMDVLTTWNDAVKGTIFILFFTGILRKLNIDAILNSISFSNFIKK